MAGFWSAIAFAELELPPPLTWGVVKGLLLRNLRWWTTQKEILTPQGTLTIGYSYPNQFMSENYNSPGSPYWFMLSFVALALPEKHPFWQSKEEDYPSTSLPEILPLRQPNHIMVRKGGHTFLLSSGQRCHYPVRASESKYGKFAYSSAFGYSVPTGNYSLESTGCDNMLALSDDHGETWRLRRISTRARIEEHEGIPILVSGWSPWSDVFVETYLLPPTDAAPSWHVRVHKIVTKKKLKISEGAFGIYGTRQQDGRELEALSDHSSEGKVEAGDSALAVSIAGVVGIAELYGAVKREGRVLNEDANSNLVHSRTVLPYLQAELATGSEIWLATAVFAVPSSALEWANWRTAWESRPSIPAWLKNSMS